MINMIKKIFDPNEKEVKRLSVLVDRINSLEPETEKLSDAELRGKTVEFGGRLDNGETLDQILPEAFAVVREAARRTIGQRHYDVQLMGGAILHEGRIAEMKTGEGKTLAATAPVYLNALGGHGVHVVTVNDYLARRDSEWMGTIYRFLGLSVGVILHDMNYDERVAAYACDVTYGTNNEFGFDYLRDNMVMRPEHMVQRELNYAIVDEVDSILIDEARTPLIISGQAEQSTDLYYRFAKVVPRLEPERHYTVDEKARTVALTDEGVQQVEGILGVGNLYDDVHFELTHYLNQALKAHSLFKRDRDYVVKDGQVIIVDEFTGRLMFGRRYSDGLHQAIEAEEGVKIEHESQTLASITFQNYFRMYTKLAGMTGTALTEEAEFQKIYGMDVVVIPTNEPMIRVDHPDVVYKTPKAKFSAAVEEIAELHQQGRPVLVGTISIEKSERLSDMLKRKGVPHSVLNAKYHESEAEIIAQAGRLNAVTIATNMAGRGTDIILGGNPEYEAREQLRKLGFSHEEIVAAAEKRPVLDAEVAAAEDERTAEYLARTAEARQKYAELLEKNRESMAAEHEKVVALGGLHIIGTERHESRRIDNQLRGRAGRQGDPGSSRFYVSLEDDLMRLFGTDRFSGLMDRLGWTEDQPIESKQISRSIENAQKKVESYHFDIRKQVLQYDDVMNQQREVIYAQRRKALVKEDLKENVLDMIREIVGNTVDMFAQEGVYPEDWDLKGLSERFSETLNVMVGVEPEEMTGRDNPALKELLDERAVQAYRARENEIGDAQFRQLEKLILLRVIDAKWMDHLRAMDELREGIGLRAYGQKDPLLEYKFEAFEMFKQMVASIQEDVVKYMFRVQLVSKQDAERERERTRVLRTNRDAQAEAGGGVKQRHVKKVGRNDPCPCGSGKKYKKCCGKEQ